MAVVVVTASSLVQKTKLTVGGQTLPKPKLVLKKGKRASVGAVRTWKDGKRYRKTAQGWVMVGKGRKKKAVKTGKVQQGTLPHDVSKLTVESATSLIEQASKMPLKTLRRNQDIVEQQKGLAYKKKKVGALDRLEAMGDMYTAAVAIREFKDSTPKEWAEEIVARIKRNAERQAQWEKEHGGEQK